MSAVRGLGHEQRQAIATRSPCLPDRVAAARADLEHADRVVPAGGQERAGKLAAIRGHERADLLTQRQPQVTWSR